MNDSPLVSLPPIIKLFRLTHQLSHFLFVTFYHVWSARPQYLWLSYTCVLHVHVNFKVDVDYYVILLHVNLLYVNRN